MRAWLTIDEPGDLVCRAFVIPRNFVPHVMGALGQLCDYWAWEKQGALTPEQCATYMSTMWASAHGGCDVIGSMQLFATAQLPTQYLPCDFGVYNRVDYPDLYAVIDASLIIDADTFHTPPMQDRVPIGAGAAYAIGATGGEAAHTLTAGEMPAHDHTIQNGFGPNVVNGYLGATPALVPVPTPETTSATGGSGAHNNLPPYAAFTWGIRHSL